MSHTCSLSRLLWCINESVDSDSFATTGHSTIHWKLQKQSPLIISTGEYVQYINIHKHRNIQTVPVLWDRSFTVFRVQECNSIVSNRGHWAQLSWKYTYVHWYVTRFFKRLIWLYWCFFLTCSLYISQWSMHLNYFTNEERKRENCTHSCMHVAKPITSVD